MTVRRGGRPVLQDVSLALDPNEYVCVLGPSGAGKTTLLRAIAGLEPLAGGTVAIAGADVTTRPPQDRGVSMVFQTFALFPHMSVAKNIAFELEARGVRGPEREQRVRDAAERLEITPLLERRPSTLSGGERQRVALARSLAARPRLLLLDEPLSNLDAPLRARARTLIRTVVREAGITALHVTHDQAEAFELGDRIAILARGRLAAVGSEAQLRAGAQEARFLAPDGRRVRVEVRVYDDDSGEEL